MSPRATAVIEVIARDKASSVLRGIAGSLQRVGEVAAGVAVARMMERGIKSAIGLARAGIDIASSYMLVERGMTALLAVQKMYTSAQWEEVKVGTKIRRLTKEELERREKLRTQIKQYRADLNLLNARMQEQAQRVWEMKNKWTEQGLATKTAQARLEKMQVQQEVLTQKLQEAEAELARLNALEGKQIAITKRVMKPTTSYSEALSLVQEDVAAVWDETRKLAIMRGVPASVIASAYQYGFAVGMPLETLKELVPGMVDFAVATGKTEPEMKRMVKVMGDIASRGRLAAQEIYQLANVNIPILDLLADKLGKSREEVMKLVEQGAIPAELVFETLQGYFSLTSQAAEQMSGTFPILINSLKEMLRLGVYEFFSPILDVLGDMLKTIRDFALEIGIFDKLKEKGKAVASKLESVRDRLKEILDKIRESENPFETIKQLFFDFIKGLLPENAGEILKFWENLKGTISDIADQVGTVIGLLFGKTPEQSEQASSALERFNESWEKVDSAIKGAFWGAIIGGLIALITGNIPLGIAAMLALGAIIGWLNYQWKVNKQKMAQHIIKIASWILWFKTVGEQALFWVGFSVWTLADIIGQFGQMVGEHMQRVALHFLRLFEGATAADRLRGALGLLLEGFIFVGEMASNFASSLALLIRRLFPSLTLAKRLADWLEKVAKAIENVVKGIKDFVEDPGKKFEEMLSGLAGLAGDLVEALGGIIARMGLLKGAKLGPFQPGSPSPFETSVRGVTDAFRELRSLIRGMALQPVPAYATAPSGPTYNVNVYISGGTPESAREAAYEAVLEAFKELEAQLVL